MAGRLEALWNAYQTKRNEIQEQMDASEDRYTIAYANLEISLRDTDERISHFISTILPETADETKKTLREKLGNEATCGTTLTALEERLGNRAERVAGTIESYTIHRLDMTPYHYAAEAIAKRREMVERMHISEEEKDAFYAVLDRADEVFVGENPEHTAARSGRGEDLGKAVERETRKRVKELIEMPENAVFVPVFGEKTHGFDANHTEGNATPEEVRAARDAYTFEISPELKENIRAIWQALDENGLGAGREVGEFTKYSHTFLDRIREDATNIEDIILNSTMEEITAATEAHAKTEAGIRAVMALGRELFPGDDNSGYISNISSMRDPSIPPDLKDSARVLSNINVVSLMQNMLRGTDIDLETFLDNPVVAMRDAVQNYMATYGPDGTARGTTLGQQLASLSTADPRTGMPIYVDSVARILSAMAEMEPNMEVREANLVKNAFAVVDLSAEHSGIAVTTCFMTNFAESTKHVFLVEPENLHLIEHGVGRNNIDMRTMKQREPFDAIGYLESTQIDPKALAERITNGLVDFASNGGKREHLNALVENARETIRQVVAVKNITAKTPGFKELAAIYDDPHAVMVAAAKTRGGNKPMPDVKKAPETLASYGKKIDARMKADQKARAAFEKAETAFDKTRVKLQKALEKAQKAAATKETTETNQKMLNARAEYELHIHNRKRELRDLAAEGKITALYYETRISAIDKGVVGVRHSQYVAGLTDKKSFVAARMQSGVDKKRAEAMFRAASAKEATEIRAIAGRAVAKMPAKEYHGSGFKPVSPTSTMKEVPKQTVRRSCQIPTTQKTTQRAKTKTAPTTDRQKGKDDPNLGSK